MQMALSSGQEVVGNSSYVRWCTLGAQEEQLASLSEGHTEPFPQRKLPADHRKQLLFPTGSRELPSSWPTPANCRLDLNSSTALEWLLLFEHTG